MQYIIQFLSWLHLLLSWLHKRLLATRKLTAVRLPDKNMSYPTRRNWHSGLGRCSSHPQGPLSASSKAKGKMCWDSSCFKKTDVTCYRLSASPLLIPATNFSLPQNQRSHRKLLHLGKGTFLFTSDWAEAIYVHHAEGSNIKHSVPSQPQKIYSPA